MFKSKIFFKVMSVVLLVIMLNSILMFFVVIPEFNANLQKVETKNAKDNLSKLTIISENVVDYLKFYKEDAINKYKQNLQNLTQTAWSIIQTKYNQSKKENIGIILENRSNEFEANLMNFYNENKNNISKKQMKKEILNYINMYRYENGIGYFWVNDFKPNMILHPIIKSLNGTYLGDFKDPNGIYPFNDMVKVCKKSEKGLVQYQWLNPKSKKIEDKISYVFTFKPFHWIIGTGEYVSVLQSKLQNEVIEIVRGLRYSNKNYFFIYDYNNIAISHPYIQGKDMTNVKDKKGDLIVPPFIKLAREKGEGFTKYWWTKNSVDGKAYEKLTFVKNFPDWEIVIATGVFIDDIEKQIKNRKKQLIHELQNMIKSIKIGKTGYLYIFDTDGKIIAHPDKDMIGKSIKKMINNQTGDYLFDDLIKAYKSKDKVLYYKWNRLDDKKHYIYNKIAWIEYIPELKLYISSSIYESELTATADKARVFILWLTVALIIISCIISFIMIKNIIRPIFKLVYLSKRVSKGDYSIRVKIDKNDEFAILAESFNKMIDTTEDLIDNLDEKIDERTKELKTAKKELEQINKHTKDSIEYASLIQGALMPKKNVMTPFFKDYFVTWIPKDTVGGDIWLFDNLRNKDECLLMFIDCTGHGVAGAFVTMIVKSVEREITSMIKSDKSIDISPAWIMSYFNKIIKKLLAQESKDSLSNVGFDGGVIYYNKKTQILKFAGAETTLFYMTNNGEFKTIKGDRYSVGYKKCDANYKYKETIIEVKENMKFYCTTDGYLDQNGGEKDFPFGKKRFTNIIKENYKKPMRELKRIFKTKMMAYKSAIPNNTRTDDITLIAFEIGENSK